MNNPIYNRRSVRKYFDKYVPREMIEQVIDAGRMAPSAKNRQHRKYIVLGGESKAEFPEHMKKEITHILAISGVFFTIQSNKQIFTVG